MQGLIKLMLGITEFISQPEIIEAKSFKEFVKIAPHVIERMEASQIPA